MFGKIIGTGSYVPERILKNEDLAQFVDTNDEWIRERTGVEERHVMTDETTTDMAVEAARKAVEAAGIDVEEIDMIILSSVSSNLILPNTACYVQEKLGAVNAMCFDINTACTGFMMAYNTVQSYMNTGLINTALIIGAEGLSRIVDWRDRGTCVLFGDGAGAAVIKKDETAVFDTVMHADGASGSALTCDAIYSTRPRLFDKEMVAVDANTSADINIKDNAGINTKETSHSNEINIEETDDKIDNTYVRMDGQEVFRFAVKQVPLCIQELMAKLGIAVDDVDMFILHQANKRIIQSVIKRIGAPEEKVPMNVMRYGNTSSACIPILMDELVKEGKLKKGDKIIMSGFGAGLTWSATYLEY